MFDTDIEENEPTLDLENDPDIALLIDDEEEQTEGEPAKKQVAPPKPALDEETQSIIDRLKKDPSLLDRRTPPPVVEQPRQPVQPQPTFDLEKQADEFERDFIKDPKQAYKKHIVGLVAGVAQTVRSNVEQDMNARFGRQGMGNAENVIDSYVKTIRDSNPLVDDEVERRVLERIEEAKKTNATVI